MNCLICSSLRQYMQTKGEREIYGSQSPRIANIMATNPKEAKAHPRGSPSISRSIDLSCSKYTRSVWQSGRPERRDTLMDSKKIYRERYWTNPDAPSPRFSVIRRFLCKRIFWYSDRSTRLDANEGWTTVIPQDTCRFGGLSPRQRGFPCDRALYPPRVCLGGGK